LHLVSLHRTLPYRTVPLPLSLEHFYLGQKHETNHLSGPPFFQEAELIKSKSSQVKNQQVKSKNPAVMMLCSRSRTRTRTHTRTLLLLVLVVTVAHRLQSSTVLGMTIPFSNGNGFSSSGSGSSGSGSGHHEWHETASGIPTTGADWITLPNGQEFQPATFGGDGADGDAGSADHSHSDHSNHSDSEQERAKLVRAQRRFLGYRDNFVDGTETFYSERSQAWRLLGVYIDCDAQDNGDDHKDRRDRDRQLKQQPPQQQQPQSGAGAGLKQQVPKEEDDQDNRKLEDDVQQCQRYMLWAGVSSKSSGNVCC
jgi:hypothetical protein